MHHVHEGAFKGQKIPGTEVTVAVSRMWTCRSFYLIDILSVVMSVPKGTDFSLSLVVHWNPVFLFLIETGSHTD